MEMIRRGPQGPPTCGQSAGATSKVTVPFPTKSAYSVGVAVLDGPNARSSDMVNDALYVPAPVTSIGETVTSPVSRLRPFLDQTLALNEPEAGLLSLVSDKLPDSVVRARKAATKTKVERRTPTVEIGQARCREKFGTPSDYAGESVAGYLGDIAN